jgi:NTP pyrophosphatase (non-canonical NTP hydrolase)
MKKTLNEYRDDILAYAKSKGFEKSGSLGESLMLVVSELSEALEADRKNKWCIDVVALEDLYKENDHIEIYKNVVRGTVEEEIADALLRLFGLAGFYEIDLDWHITAKMEYNKTRPYKCGKKYG